MQILIKREVLSYTVSDKVQAKEIRDKEGGYVIIKNQFTKMTQQF